MRTATSLEKMIATALLVPMGNGDPSSGPLDKDCVWGLPLLLWGSPGIGKSGRLKAACRSVFLEAKTVFAATRAPEDFSGAPFIKGDKLVNECILGAVRELCEIGRGVLFLDEISCAVPAVQAALLGVILDRVVGDTKLPYNVRVLAAANPPSEAAGGWDLSPPMANRFAHLNVQAPSSSEWINWLLQESRETLVETEQAQEVLAANWPTAFARVKGMAAGFFHALPEGRLYNMPKAGDKARGKAWPSPRTWEMAIRAAATCYATNTPPTMIHEFVEACVGEGVAAEWVEWVSKANLPHPLEVVTKGWMPDKLRLDKSVAVFTSMTSFVLNEKDEAKQQEYAVGAWNVLTKALEIGLVDLAVAPAQELVRRKLASTSSDAVAAAAKPLTMHLGKTGMAELARAKR